LFNCSNRSHKSVESLEVTESMLSDESLSFFDFITDSILELL